MKNHQTSSSRHNKLAAYAAFTSAALGMITTSQAAVIYTDVDPDVMLNGPMDSLAIDLNNDGTMDLKFTIDSTAPSFYAAVANAYGSNAFNGAMASYTTSSGQTYTYRLPFAMSVNQPVDTALPWQQLARQYLAGYYNVSGYNGTYGYWNGATNKFLGVRFDISGRTHFGWVRLDVANEGRSMTIKDYAYEDVDSMAILTGAGLPALPADSVLQVTATDARDNHDGSDLKIQFDKVTDEATIDQYRVFVVKTADAAAFDLATAEAVGTGNYENVNKTGANITHYLKATAKDVDGDLIQEGVAYKVFVMSVADGVFATVNTLSPASNEVTLVDMAVGITNRLDNDDAPSIYTIGKSIVIEGKGIPDPTSTVQVFNLAGSLVVTEQLKSGNQLVINMHAFPGGLYLVHINGDKSSSSTTKLWLP